jgi:hypothetical protein
MSGALNTLAVSLMKIGNDIRLLGSGLRWAHLPAIVEVVLAAAVVSSSACWRQTHLNKRGRGGGRLRCGCDYILVVEVSGALNTLAASLMKIGTDICLLGSGPRWALFSCVSLLDSSCKDCQLPKHLEFLKLKPLLRRYPNEQISAHKYT